MVIILSVVVMVTVCPISRHGSEWRAEPNRTHDSLSTFRVVRGTQLEPQRRQWAEQRLLDGQLFGGIAPISECTVALISAHQAAANVLAVARSSKGC